MQRAWQFGVAWSCCLCLGLACGAESQQQPEARDAASRATAEDRDADGLCDGSELAMGTDPDRADTDGDGLLDGHELIAGTDARERDDPAQDHIVFLLRGTREDFAVTLSADGSGSDVTGAFRDRNAFDLADRRASEFYRSSTAVAAQPPENVRAVVARQARFASVLGPTRLQFSLHFADVAQDSSAADAGAEHSNAAYACASVLPFDYGAAADDGTELSSSQERFVLIVADTSPPLTAAQYCLPAACL